MSSVKTKNLTPLYAFIQGLYWMNFAAIMGYSGFYLLGSGFSNTEIGIIISSAGAGQLCRPSGKPFPEKIPAVTAGVAADSRNFPSFLQINIANRSCLWLRCDPASASDPVYQFSWNGKYQSGT